MARKAAAQKIPTVRMETRPLVDLSGSDVEAWASVGRRYPNYEVSTLGGVRNARHGRALRQGASGCGYLTVQLWADGVGKTHRVHAIVARAFLGSAPPGMVVNHKGGIKTDNRVVNAQSSRICPDAAVEWVVGDSAEVIPALDVVADLVFSCPPYADLEVYSDDPRDLSNMPFEGFIDAYRRIIAASVAKFADDRFACFVVGDIRDKRGIYRNFPAETTRAFDDAGASIYNEAVLVTAVGSLPIRAGRQFEAGRKLGKTHQNVLVFVKGDPKRATTACGPCEVGAMLGDDAERTGG